MGLQNLLQMQNLREQAYAKAKAKFQDRPEMLDILEETMGPQSRVALKQEKAIAKMGVRARVGEKGEV